MKWLDVIWERLRHAHPDHYTIARGMAWVSWFVFLGSIVRVAKEVAIASRYGVGVEVDAYLFVFNLVVWPVGIWFSVLTVVLVPLAARIWQDASVELPRFRAELLGLTLLLGVVLVLLVWLLLPVLLRSSWTGLPEATSIIATNMVPMLALLAPLGLLISLLSTWMLAAGWHANTLLESVPALAVLVTLLAFSGSGAEPLVWGTFAGFALHLVCLATPLVRRGELEGPRFTRQSPQWIPFWQGFGIMLGGQAFMGLTGIIDQFFAAHLGTGAIASLGYANRVLALIVGMGAMAVSRATLPVFSKAQAQGDEQVYRVAARWVRLLLVLGFATMAVSWGLAPWGIKLLFERGAFTSQDTAIVVELFRYGLPQLPFYFAGIVLVSLLASQGRHGAIAVVAGTNLLVKILAVQGLTAVFGIKGIALATSLMYATTLVLLGVVVKTAKK